MIELTGSWTAEGRRAVISVQFTSADLGEPLPQVGNSLWIDMSAWNRPAAHGTVDDESTITVTFPDKAETFKGHLQPPNKIRWSNGTVWTKAVNTVMELTGSWTDGSGRAVISEDDSKADSPYTLLKIDMSDWGRPAAHGFVVDDSTIEVTFPDAETFKGHLQLPNKIRWSNNTVWTKI